MAAAMAALFCVNTLQAGEKVWHFDDMQTQKLPAGWKADVTNGKKGSAVWQVVLDKSAPSPRHVLALTDINHHSGAAFNLCRMDGTAFLDGEIEVKFRANRGRIDQGGGIIWRVQDNKNYYIARFNPLEDNFRLYFVKNGHRRVLASADVRLHAGEWHTMKIVQKGDRYAGYLDGKKYLKGRDGTFAQHGGVGLWTKADAATSFDDFLVKVQ
jgi:hypothetical protein